MTDIAIQAETMMQSNPALQEASFKHWNLVCDKVQERALARRPKPKSFEVHHEIEVARKAFLGAIVANHSPELAEVMALEAIGF